MSTWTPNTSNDTLEFAAVNVAPGVFGQASDVPALVTRAPGATLKLDASVNETGLAQASEYPPEMRWRRLPGVLTTNLTS